MSLADLLHEAPSPRDCIVGRAIKSLSDADQKVLAEALEAGISKERVTRALTAYGLPVGASAVSRHYRGVCACRK